MAFFLTFSIHAMLRAGLSPASGPASGPAILPAQPSVLLSDVPEEVRIQRAIEAIQTGQLKSIAAAARQYSVLYYRLRSWAQGARSRSTNSSGNTLLTPLEELALHAWVNFQLSIGLSAFSILLYPYILLTKRGKQESLLPIFKLRG